MQTVTLFIEKSDRLIIERAVKIKLVDSLSSAMRQAIRTYGKVNNITDEAGNIRPLKKP